MSVTYYRNNLDEELCCAFDSLKGREYFTDALSTEYMNIYFKLSQHFVTQETNNSCALASLVMVLNGLGVDPGRKWKCKWRWFDESMINTCRPIEKVHKGGIGFESFLCISRLNYVDPTAVRALPSLSTNYFRKDVKRCCRSTDKAMIVNFSRKFFNQDGSGHYAVIGGYNENADVILIMETARYKYSPYWVNIEDILEAMKEIAYSKTGATENMPRGYVMLQKSYNSSLYIQLSHLHTNMRLDNTFEFVTLWKTWIKNDMIYPDKLVIDTVNTLLECLCKQLTLNGKELFKLMRYVASHKTKHSEVWNVLVNIFYALNGEVKKLEQSITKYIKDNFDCIEPEKMILQFIANWIMLWQYDTSVETTTYEWSLSKLAKKEFITRDDVAIQLQFLKDIVNHCDHKTAFMKERLNLQL